MAVVSTQQISAAFAHNSVNVNSKWSESISHIWESIKFCWATDSIIINCVNIRDRYYSSLLSFSKFIVKILILATNES